MKISDNKRRRKLINSITATSALVTLQSDWARPVVQSVLLPAHAISSCLTNGNLSGSIGGAVSVLLSAPNTGTIAVCVDGLGVQSGTFENPGIISELTINFAFQGCSGNATLNGQVNMGNVSGTFTYTLTCPSGECSGSGTWVGDATQQNPLLYAGTWAGTQSCCGNPEFVIGRDLVPFTCPF